MSFAQLVKDIRQKKFSPIYYLYGEESYFLDKISKELEANVLEPHEEAFNKVVMYGGDAKIGSLLNELRSFPMMSTRRLVMLREAQSMKKTEFEKIQPYLENPLSSTVFVLVWKGKGVDGRGKMAKLLKEKGTPFESKPVYENKVAPWIIEQVEAKGLKIEPRAVEVMVTYLGTNLGLIESEITKMALNLGSDPSKTITTALVFDMINIDKDFNVFELLNALGVRDHAKSHFIINQMMKNVKENPPIMILGQIFSFFNKLTLLKYKRLATDTAIAQELGMNPYIARQYVAAVRNFSPRELHENLKNILEADLFLKGIRTTHMSQEHVMKTLVYKVLN
ncbi:MAG: DNA polymerase III subunit delta [Bacteroidia bacterium]|nr:DNA polymerase III subunit delta [Bacteroidia bacterium]